MSDEKQRDYLTIETLVARRNYDPYVVISKNGEKVIQLSMAAARSIANDLVIACSRAEADAIIFRFFDSKDYPEGAAAALMQSFRNFRLRLDTERVDTFHSDPDAGEGVDPV